VPVLKYPEKDRAGIGHLFMAWGFLFFITYYFFFIIIASGFGIPALEHNGVYVVYCWIMDFCGAVRELSVRPGALSAGFSSIPPGCRGKRTWESLLILITVLLHPITHVNKIATQIAAGVAPAGQGLPNPPLSAWVAHLYTNSANIAAWHNFWFLEPLGFRAAGVGDYRLHPVLPPCSGRSSTT